MAMIKKQDAVARLIQSAKAARADDLVEIYNELFPEKPATEKMAKANQTDLVDKIVKHITSGLEIEEILDLWNVIFPTHRGVWFDDDKGLMHYDDKVEHAELAD